MIGQVFGSWTVMSDLGIVRQKRRWLCRCSCGKEKAQPQTVLLKGRATNCLSCARSKRPSRVRRRWAATRPEYAVWSSMVQRCTNDKHAGFQHYGARGISVCDEWLRSFIAFMDYVGARPSTRHSIDRIDNDGNYEPGNVRWATVTQQMRNRTDSRFVEFGGERLTMVEWSERTGISQACLTWRVRNWGVDRALSTPKRRHA